MIQAKDGLGRDLSEKRLKNWRVTGEEVLKL